jgi:hypothetical protein
MVFYDGEKRIEVELITKLPNNKGGVLQGIYKTPDGRLFVLRIAHKKRSRILRTLDFYRMLPTAAGDLRESLFGFFSVEKDLAHMLSPSEGFGMSLKGASKAERHVRARRRGTHTFTVRAGTPPGITRVLFRLHYRTSSLAGRDKTITKDAKFQPLDDLDKFHRIEAIDPKTGKARIFTFPIRK